MPHIPRLGVWDRADGSPPPGGSVGLQPHEKQRELEAFRPGALQITANHRSQTDLSSCAEPHSGAVEGPAVPYPAAIRSRASAL